MTKNIDLTQEEIKTLADFTAYVLETANEINLMINSDEWIQNEQQYLQETSDFLDEQEKTLEPILQKIKTWRKNNG